MVNEAGRAVWPEKETQREEEEQKVTKNTECISNELLSGSEVAFPDENEFSLQCNDEFSLLGESEIDLQGEEEDDLVSEDEVDVQPEETFQSRSNDSFLNSNEDKEKKEELYIGMEFSSDESAYRAYAKYGGKSGFNVRKQRRTRNKKGLVVRLVYCCSKEGFRKTKTKGETSYSVPVTRVGCKAHMSCYRQNNGKLKIVSFERNHNHELIKTPMKHMLKINRSFSKAQKEHADDAEMSGISAKATVELMSREVGGRENLGFMEKDYRNYIHRKRRLDEDDMITNIFWADERSISDYGLFGDVVCFDTTYQTNEYGRPFAPFVGVNHHKQTVVFGAALLYDETIESFKWLFETFLGAMSGKQPKTILTDQSAAIASAIAEVFPVTYHRLCIWHIYQNAAKRLSHVFHGSQQFAHDFGKCVYDYEDEDDWLLAWNNMLEKHNLKEDKWLKNLFDVREKWALPSYDLLCFFEHYERVLADRRYEELIADFKMMQTSPVLSANVEMLQHAEEVYTPEAFRLFQQQYTSIGDYVANKVSKSEMQYEYKVSYRGVAREHLVKFDASMQTITCSCMKFNFVGILCHHAMKVLDRKNVRRIPPTCILNRWSKEAKARSIASYHGPKTNENLKQSIGKRYSHLCRNYREIASFASEHEEQIEKKKKLLKEDAWVIQTSDVGALEGEVSNARGVKRKATVGRPRGRHGRFKGVLEGKSCKATSKASTSLASKAAAKKQLSFQDSIPTSDNCEQQEVNEYEVLMLDSATQESNLSAGTQVSVYGTGLTL
ncbi:protein FAR1-RELATED SEQUENCE 5-like [Rosa chinensis]|uniref:protein FAR1-RELATED SEQUENCE 5-like n=1 Tax=Rosa chinensis TaxID=74649 RepID=UPI000D08B507|nr:protein FAR1-RELATED SEQUENCE 5-like [Rosa chinensis]